MAKTTNAKASEIAKEFDEFNETPKAPAGKKINVIFIGLVRADFGAFDAGDTAELDAKLADSLIKDGFAKVYTPSKETNKPVEEEF